MVEDMNPTSAESRMSAIRSLEAESEAPCQPPPEGTGDEATDREALDRRLQSLPREIGVLLVTIGAVGILLPGMVGTPALVAGGMLLWPRGFRSVDGWLRQRFPKFHAGGTRQILRYLDDMETRYPTP